jgi:hypothetical protein
MLHRANGAQICSFWLFDWSLLVTLWLNPPWHLLSQVLQNYERQGQKVFSSTLFGRFSHGFQVLGAVEKLTKQTSAPGILQEAADAQSAPSSVSVDSKSSESTVPVYSGDRLALCVGEADINLEHDPQLRHLSHQWNQAFERLGGPAHSSSAIVSSAEGKRTERFPEKSPRYRDSLKSQVRLPRD